MSAPTAPKLREAMDELRLTRRRTASISIAFAQLAAAADDALAAYDARDERRRARKAARAKPAAGERAGVDAAALDAAVERLVDAVAYAAGYRMGSMGHEGAEADRAVSAARAALRALVLGDGKEVGP